MSYQIALYFQLVANVGHRHHLLIRHPFTGEQYLLLSGNPLFAAILSKCCKPDELKKALYATMEPDSPPFYFDEVGLDEHDIASLQRYRTTETFAL